jgi:hypothetical protein
MKILYSKKRRKYDLFYTIFCLLIGVLSLFFSETNHKFFYLYMPLVNYGNYAEISRG